MLQCHLVPGALPQCVHAISQGVVGHSHCHGLAYSACRFFRRAAHGGSSGFAACRHGSPQCGLVAWLRSRHSWHVFLPMPSSRFSPVHFLQNSNRQSLRCHFCPWLAKQPLHSADHAVPSWSSSQDSRASLSLCTMAVICCHGHCASALGSGWVTCLHGLLGYPLLHGLSVYTLRLLCLCSSSELSMMWVPWHAACALGPSHHGYGCHQANALMHDVITFAHTLCVTCFQ